MGTAILAPLVARPLLCTARVRRAADFASFTFAPASEQKRLPRTPPSESAVIVRCTLSRWTINPNRLRSSGPSVRSRIGQIFCADENRRKPFTGATNALRALPAVTSFGASADGWNCAIAAPIAYKRPPRFTKRETVNRTVSVPICFVSFVLCGCVEPLEVAVDAPRASMAVATIAAARARYLRDIVPPSVDWWIKLKRYPEGRAQNPLSPTPRGPTLLEEGEQALLPLLAGAEPRGDPRQLLTLVRPLPHEALRGPCRLRPRPQDVANDALHGAVELVRELVHETDPQRNRRVEPLTRQEQPSRGAGPDLGEDERRDHRRDDSEAYLREAEGRVARCDCDVRAGDEAGAAAERVALHAGDDRRRARVDGGEHPVQPERVLDVLLEAEVDRGALPLDVRAGAEALAFSREHDRARIAHVREGVPQLADHLRVEGIAPLRPRDRDMENIALALDTHPRHAAG